QVSSQNQCGSAVVHKPRATGFRPLSVQNHDCLGLGVEKIGKLDSHGNVVIDVVEHRTVQEACLIIPQGVFTDNVTRCQQILGTPVICQANRPVVLIVHPDNVERFFGLTL